MMNYDDLLVRINNLYSADGTGEKSKTFYGLTLGVVVDTDDPLQQNRVRVFCPALNDNPKKLHHLPWALYVTPFGGSINNSSFTRGYDPGNCTSSGAVQYGWWGPVEQGAHVLVGCVDGDARRRFFVGCVYEHQETHGVLTGRWKWGEGGVPDGPLTSTNSPLEPLHTNLLKAFKDNTSREWRTRAAEYQVAAVREDIGETPNNNKKTYLDQQYDKISEAEPDDWVKPILGAHGYDWSGNKALGSFMNSRVYGFSSPGQHSFLMDDRAFNSRMKLRTTAGHQIILDDTNERIYINTAEGNSWIELDKSGNIDVYSERRISFHAKKDINFTTDETFRVKAKKGIHLYAGDNKDQENLPNPPEDGEIRIQSEADMHIISKKNLRQLTFIDNLVETGGKKCESIGDSLFQQVQNEINILTNTGDYNLTVSKDLNEMVRGDAKKFAAGQMQMSSTGNAEIFSFDGKMDVGSQLTMNLKSMSQDVAVEALGANSGKTGGVFIKSPESQHSVTSSGITAATNKSIKQKAAENIEMQNAVETKQDYPQPPQDTGPCDIGGQVPTDGYTGADLAARAAYNAGFRGDSLVTAVAIAGAESSYNPGAVGDVGLQNSKWGPSVGMWQNRTLKNPEQWSGVDRKRDINQIGGSGNLQNNANIAYDISKNGTNFRPWSTFTDGAYKKYLDGAKTAVDNMCNPNPAPAPNTIASTPEAFQEVFAVSDIKSIIEECILGDILSTGNIFKMDGSAINMQSITDIALKGALSSTNMFEGLYTKINDLAIAHDIFAFLTQTTFLLQSTAGPYVAAAQFVAQAAAFLDTVIDIIGNGPDFGAIAATLLSDLGLNISVEDICSYALPHFDPEPQLIFFDGNFDAFEGTNIGTPGSSGSVPENTGDTGE